MAGFFTGLLRMVFQGLLSGVLDYLKQRRTEQTLVDQGALEQSNRQHQEAANAKRRAASVPGLSRGQLAVRLRTGKF